MTTTRLLITAEEVAIILGLKKFQVYSLVRSDLIPCVRIGRKVMFSVKALEAWIDNGGTRLNERNGALGA